MEMKSVRYLGIKSLKGFEGQSKNFVFYRIGY